MKGTYFTTNEGAPVPNEQAAQTVGKCGPILLQDAVFIEKLAHFTRERIPARVLHAKGAGAYGRFCLRQSMERYTQAAFLQNPGQETPVFVRFSLATGAPGGADTVRDIRGFSVKFYTSSGNYDLVGNHIPVFPIRDPMQFPDLVHALRPNPISNIQGGRKGSSRFWDFMSLHPESTYFLLYLFSDAGIVCSYRHMRGFSVNTYKWVNCAGEETYVKYRWEPAEGAAFLDGKRAGQLAGSDPDALARDLFNAIESRKEIRYELSVQLLRPAGACDLPFDPLDPTKEWPSELAPHLPVGALLLERNPENYFAEVEQSAFSPAALVPGIAFSNDRILQGRAFAYGDAQRYRLGVNYQELPVNRPVVPVVNNMQDGAMQFSIEKRLANYYPNTLSTGLPKLAPKTCKDAAACLQGCVVREKLDFDDFAQARQFYQALNAEEKEHLAANLAASLAPAALAVRKRALANFACVSGELQQRLGALLS